MSENTSITSICGPPAEGQTLPNIGSDPNYVFVNDPEFNTIRLFDLDGNIINVNSWIECAHYVQGGWSTNQQTLINSETTIFYILSAILTSYFLFKIIKNMQK